MDKRKWSSLAQLEKFSVWQRIWELRSWLPLMSQIPREVLRKSQRPGSPIKVPRLPSISLCSNSCCLICHPFFGSEEIALLVPFGVWRQRRYHLLSPLSFHLLYLCWVKGAKREVIFKMRSKILPLFETHPSYQIESWLQVSIKFALPLHDESSCSRLDLKILTSFWVRRCQKSPIFRNETWSI